MSIVMPVMAALGKAVSASSTTRWTVSSNRWSPTKNWLRAAKLSATGSGESDGSTTDHLQVVGRRGGSPAGSRPTNPEYRKRVNLLRDAARLPPWALQNGEPGLGWCSAVSIHKNVISLERAGRPHYP